jgi:hypothetical protein
VSFVAAILLRDSGAGTIIGVVIAAIIILIALIARAFGFGKPDPTKWYGKMNCSRCGYC